MVAQRASNVMTRASLLARGQHLTDQPRGEELHADQYQKHGNGQQWPTSLDIAELKPE